MQSKTTHNSITTLKINKKQPSAAPLQFLPHYVQIHKSNCNGATVQRFY